MLENKDILSDMHVHTIASVHAYSTLRENINAALNQSLRYIAITDHYYRDTQYGAHNKQENSRLKVLNGDIACAYKDSPFGIGIISGVELNFGHECDYPEVISTLGIKLGGFHDWFFNPEKYNCRDFHCSKYEALRLAMKECPIDIIVHPERDLHKVFEGDKKKLSYLKDLVDYAHKGNKILEVNETSLRRGDLRELMKYWLELALKKNIRLSLGSDAHVDIYIGKFDRAINLLNEIGYPKELIVNTDETWLSAHAKTHQND